MCKIIQVLVCYFNEEEIVDFAMKIFEQDIAPNKVVIVDNGSRKKDLLSTIQKKYPERILLKNPGKNLGYWGAFEMAIKEKEEYDYYILSNSDISFLDIDFYKNICKCQLTSKKRIGIIAPTILSKDLKHNLNPFLFNRSSVRKIKILKMIYKNELFAIIYNLLHYIKNYFSIKKEIINIDSTSGRQNDIYAPHGSFMIFTRQFINKNTFNYKAFLFGEEIYVGEVCKKLNLKVRYYPNLKLIHNEHTTTGFFQTGMLLKYKYDSLCFLYNFLKENNK